MKATTNMAVFLGKGSKPISFSPEASRLKLQLLVHCTMTCPCFKNDWTLLIDMNCLLRVTGPCCCKVSVSYQRGKVLLWNTCTTITTKPRKQVQHSVYSADTKQHGILPYNEAYKAFTIDVIGHSGLFHTEPVLPSLFSVSSDALQAISRAAYHREKNW